ncbi:uncharacterized protein [Dendrobates tinctorius]|uniref:uncharacterized protein isoform X1 n=1 Tax=Dendrobates tinctorius TaxID=92724 RepID=UPI003CC97366
MAFKAIINEKPKFPSWLDADVKHVIKKLLCKNPQTRLGVHSLPPSAGRIWRKGEQSLHLHHSGEPPSAVAGAHSPSPRGRIYVRVSKLGPVDEKISTVKKSTTIWMSPCQLPRTSCLLTHASCLYCCTSPRLPFNINSLYTIFIPDHCHCCPRPLTLPPPILGWILTSFQPQEQLVLTFHLVSSGTIVAPCSPGAECKKRPLSLNSP